MATTGVAMRYERVHRMDTTPSSTPTWTIMGNGFKELEESLEPNVDEAQYVSDTTSTKTVTAYAPSVSFDGDVIKDDACIAFLRSIGDARSTGEDCEVDVVAYDLWMVGVEATTSNVEALKQTYVAAIDSVGKGSGGEKLGFAGTLHAKGDPTHGWYNTSTHAFVAVS